MMQKKAQFWMLILMVVSADAVLSAPKETPRVTSVDRAEPDVITNSMGMKLVRIPAGEFMMGAEEDRCRHDDRVSLCRSCAALA